MGRRHPSLPTRHATSRGAKSCVRVKPDHLDAQHVRCVVGAWCGGGTQQRSEVSSSAWSVDKACVSEAMPSSEAIASSHTSESRPSFASCKVLRRESRDLFALSHQRDTQASSQRRRSSVSDATPLRYPRRRNPKRRGGRCNWAVGDPPGASMSARLLPRTRPHESGLGYPGGRALASRDTLNLVLVR